VPDAAVVIVSCRFFAVVSIEYDEDLAAVREGLFGHRRNLSSNAYRWVEALVLQGCCNAGVYRASAIIRGAFRTVSNTASVISRDECHDSRT
jgi:hypothetical protein